MSVISIRGRKIGLNHYPYIIAELSANHNGKLETAMKIIQQAKLAGADAVKLQTYTADTITLNSDRPEFKISSGLWKGRTLYDLYQEAHMPWEWHKPLFEYAKEQDITIFSSPFDFTAVDLLESLNAPAYKIASFEAIDIPLIRYVAQTKKPMIISTGMASLVEIEEAIATAQSSGCTELAILHCVSGYPAPPEDYQLRTIPDLIQKFNLVTGLSDHTLSNTTAITSIALGASIVEKHFTLDRNGNGPDDSFSLEPHELKALCTDTKVAWDSLGTINYNTRDSEQGNIQFRRSLYFVKEIQPGEIITADAVRSVRPGNGLPPKLYDQVIGKVAKRHIEKNSPVMPEDSV